MHATAEITKKAPRLEGLQGHNKTRSEALDLFR